MTGLQWAKDLQILDLVHESIYARDRDRRITFWNSSAAELYGWTREEALGKNVLELLHCDYPASVSDCEAQLFETGNWRGEIRRQSKEGASLLVDVTWALRRDEEGEPVEIIETGRDITSKRRDDEARRLSEYRFRNLFDVMAVAFWEIDFNDVGSRLIPLRRDDGPDLRTQLLSDRPFVRDLMRTAKVIDVNAKTLELFGAESREQMVGGDIARYWPEASETVFIEALVAAMEGRPHFITETSLLNLNGDSVDVVFTVSWSPESRREGIVLLGLIDIGDRKAAFDALRKSELKYRNLFHYLPASLWQLNSRQLIERLTILRGQGVSDLDGYFDEHPEFLREAMELITVEEVNELTVTMFGGANKSEFEGPIGRYWVDSPDTIRRSLCARYRGETSYQEEAKVRTLDGRTLDIFFTSAFPPGLAEMGITIVAAMDIGDRLKAEEALGRVQAEYAHAARIATLGELTASIAHEVNQPLAAIATNGEASLRWLGRPAPDVDEVRTLASRMVADARRAADVITRIRAMASAQAPKRELVDVNHLVEESMQFLRRDLSAHGVTPRIDLEDRLPFALSDQTQLQQVIVNLILNASQAMQSNPVHTRQLTIRTRAVGDQVRVEVEDQGPGVSSTDSGKLFDSFFTTKEKGLGIGLPICRSIIEAHGGKIAFENLPKGARFHFTVPAAGEAQPSISHIPRYDDAKPV